MGVTGTADACFGEGEGGFADGGFEVSWRCGGEPEVFVGSEDVQEDRSGGLDYVLWSVSREKSGVMSVETR